MMHPLRTSEHHLWMWTWKYYNLTLPNFPVQMQPWQQGMHSTVQWRSNPTDLLKRRECVLCSMTVDPKLLWRCMEAQALEEGTTTMWSQRSPMHLGSKGEDVSIYKCLCREPCGASTAVVFREWQSFQDTLEVPLKCSLGSTTLRH